ncbi:MAG: hypothetical protein JXA67_13955 [Micromonosporaceae bacterium]|nr:hypothetical protein [Micromonosporaceae bacterium]
MRWRSAIAVAVVAGLALGCLAGCGGTRPAPAGLADALVPERPGPSASSSPSGARPSRPSRPSPTVSPSPVSVPVMELRAAVAKINGQDLRFSLGDGIAVAEGRHDAATGATELVRLVDGWKVTASVFGDTLYLAGRVPGDTVFRLAADQLPAGGTLLPTAVPLAALLLVSGITQAEVDTNTYTGRLDLTKVDPGSSPTMQRLLGHLARQAGDRASDLACTATVDGFGRLASFRTTFPKADRGHDMHYDFVVMDVESSVTIQMPSTGIVEAPPVMYEP